MHTRQFRQNDDDDTDSEIVITSEDNIKATNEPNMAHKQMTRERQKLKLQLKEQKKKNQ